MLRKSVWITALLLALTFVFFGCDDSKYAKLEVLGWKLSDAVKKLTPGNYDGSDVPFAGTGLQACGGAADVSYVINADGSLDVTTVATWGAGLDLQQAVFGFKAGDKITLKGTVVSGTPTEFGINTKPGGEKLYKSDKLAGDFAITVTLTAEDITNINGANPSAIRIYAKAGAITLKITELTAVR